MRGDRRGEQMDSMEGREIKKASTFGRLRPLIYRLMLQGNRLCRRYSLGECDNFLNRLAASFGLGSD